jgi:riboflavin synthase
MFTGLVSDIGTVERVEPRSGGMRLAIRPGTAWKDVKPGESVAVSGCCLTVVEVGPPLAFDAVPETLSRTILGGLVAGSKVNLERALALGDRLGGHLVLGHVDAVGKVVAPEGQGARMTFSLPDGIAALVAEKGSICISGISLTVAKIGRGSSGGWEFEVALIPETLTRTTLGAAEPGTAVNLEADVLARHVARLREVDPAPLTEERLRGWGY